MMRAPANERSVDAGRPAVSSVALRGSVKNAGNSVTPASASDSWQTALELFLALDELYGPYSLDVAAAPNNAQCAEYYTSAQNALMLRWYRRCWCNPPYSKPNKPLFFAKAREEMARVGGPEVISMLVPHTTAEVWWDQYVNIHGPVLDSRVVPSPLGKRTITHTAELDIEVLALKGRQTFVETTGKGYRQTTAQFSSAVVTFSRPGVLYEWSVRRVRGRPRTITPQQAVEVESMIAIGRSVDSACAKAGVNRRTWYRYALRSSLGHPGLSCPPPSRSAPDFTSATPKEQS